MDFCEAYKAKKFMATKNGVDEKAEWIRNQLEIKTYIPFREKRKIAEMIVEQNIKEEDGIKKYDSISAYIGLIVSSIAAHTTLEFSQDPIADYDLLAESGLLPQIISEFQESYNEIDIVLKMALAMELEDNNTNVLVGRFLDGVLKKLDVFADGVKEAMGEIDFKQLLGADFNKEDLAKMIGLLDKIK
jgi:hypothetical protein